MPPNRPEFQHRLPGMGQMERPLGMPPPGMPLNNMGQRQFHPQRPMMDQQRMMPPGHQFGQPPNQPGMAVRPSVMQAPRMDMQRPGQPVMMNTGHPGMHQPGMQGLPGQPGIGQGV